LSKWVNKQLLIPQLAFIAIYLMTSYLFCLKRMASFFGIDFSNSLKPCKKKLGRIPVPHTSQRMHDWNAKAQKLDVCKWVRFKKRSWPKQRPESYKKTRKNFSIAYKRQQDFVQFEVCLTRTINGKLNSRKRFVSKSLYRSLYEKHFRG